MPTARWVAGLLLALSALPALACTKTVRWNDDGLYFFKAGDGEIRGFSADLTRELLRRLGCQVQFVEMPWARALIELEQGHIDILPGAIVKPERRRYANFSTIISQSRNALFMSASAAKKYPVQRLADLAGTDFRLGAQIGVTYGEEFEALASRPEFKKLIKPVSVRRNAWRMMELGRLDGMLADTATGIHEIAQLKLDQLIQPSAVAVKTDSATYAFSKRTISPAFIEKFDQEYAALIADGSHQKLVDKYLHDMPFRTK